MTATQLTEDDRAQLTDDDRAHLAAIDDMLASVSAGPWGWRGNIDYDDPRLTSLTDHVDILGHVRHQLTEGDAHRQGIGDSDFLATDRTKDGVSIGEHFVAYEPEDTYDARYEAGSEAARNDAVQEWLTDPYGEPRTERRLAFVGTDRIYTTARNLAVFEVCRDATDRNDRRVYRADVVDIRNPNARFIAAARTEIDYLRALVARLTGEPAGQPAR